MKQCPLNNDNRLILFFFISSDHFIFCNFYRRENTTFNLMDCSELSVSPYWSYPICATSSTYILYFLYLGHYGKLILLKQPFQKMDGSFTLHLNCIHLWRWGPMVTHEGEGRGQGSHAPHWLDWSTWNIWQSWLDPTVILLGTSCLNIQIVICHPTACWDCF